MISTEAWNALRAVVAACVLLSAARPAPVEAGDAPRPRGRVVFSDGKLLEGVLKVSRDRKVIVYRGGKKHVVAFDAVRKITMHEKARELLPVWYFKEDGSDEKVFTGERYPRIEYEAEIVTADGETSRGRILPVVFYVEHGETRSRVVFKAVVKGKPGDTLESLAAPVSYVRLDASGTASHGMKVTVEAPRGRPVFVDLATFSALHPVKRGSSYAVAGIRAAADAPSPALCIAYTDAAALYVSPLRGMSPLEGKDRRAVEKIVREMPDFYTARKVLAARYAPPHALALVESTRAEKTTMRKARSFARYDFWVFEKAKGSWRYLRRIHVWRGWSAGPRPPVKKLVVLPPAWDVVPSAGTRDVLLRAVYGAGEKK